MGFNHRRMGGSRGQASSPVVKAGMALLLTGLISVCPTGFLHGANPLVLPAYADWQQPADSGKTVDLELIDADLHVVAATIQQQTGAQIVIQDGDQPFKRVTVQLHGATLSKALRYVALSAGADVQSTEDGVYVFRPAQNGGAIEESAQQQEQAPQPRKDMHWYKLVLQHAVPTQILQILGWDQDVRNVNPYDEAGPAPLNPEEQLNAAKSTVEMIGSNSTPSVPAARGQVGPAEANRSVDDGDGTEQANQFPGGFGGGFPGGGGFQGGFPGGGGFPGAGGGFPGGGGAPQNGAGGRNGQGALPTDVDHIYAIQGDNSLLVEATPEAYAQIQSIVSKLDIAPKQVQIKVEFVTASVNDVDSFGINYSIIPFPGVSGTSNLAGNGSNTSYQINVATGNLVASMESQLTNGRGKLVQSPIITTTNNVPANIHFDQFIPVQESNTVAPTNGNTIVANTTQYVNAPTNLQVTPRINSDDTVTLLLNPTLSSVTATTAGAAPQISSQSLQTLRTVRSGETMVLGGLVTKSELNQTTRIPILSDLPLIGTAFRSRNKTVSDSELLIFVTPTVIEDEDTASGSGSVTP